MSKSDKLLPVDDIIASRPRPARSLTVEVTALVLRDKRDNSIIAVYPVRDYDSTVMVVYEPEYIPSIEDVKEGLKNWGEIHKKSAYYNYLEGNSFVLEDDAKHMPSIGNILVRLETKKVEWE